MCNITNRSIYVLGRRFAVQQVKIGIIYLVRNFDIEVNKKTKIPLQIDPLYFMMATKGGVWLSFTKRN